MKFFEGLQDKVFNRTMGSPEKEELNIDDQAEKELVSWIKGRLDEAKNNPSRITFENNVITNTAYLLGFDSVFFDSRTRQLRPYAGASGYASRGRTHANLVISTAQNRLASLCKNPPRYDVRPNSNSEEDKQAARLQLKAINNRWAEERVNEKRIDLYMWMQQAGHAYIKVNWDPMKGRQIPVPPEIDPMTGEEITKGEIEIEGDVSIEACSPLSVFVDPLAKCVKDTPWLIEAKVRKLSYFRDQYGEKAKEVKAEGAWLTSIQNLLKINNMSSRSSGGSGSDKDMFDSAIEIAYYEKPTKRYPKGRLAIIAGNVILDYKDLPVGEINFVKFDDVKIGGKYYPESLITHIRPLQDQYNRNLRRKAEFLNKGLNLKIIGAKGHGLTEESVTDSTEFLQYNPVPNAGDPKPVPTPQLPQYVYTDGETLKQDISEISGRSEVSKGQIPSASIPGIGIQMLQEADETRIGVVTESNENSWADVGCLMAKFFNKYYNNKRYLKEAGEGGEYTISEYSNQDLRQHDDVIVIRGSTIPDSKTLKRQDIINAHQAGYFGPPQDPKVLRKIAKSLEFGDIEGLWEQEMVDDAQIERSIKEIEMGMIPQIHPDDNHEAHFERKNLIRKTDKFLSYTPDVQSLFLQDLEAHKQYIVAALQAEGGISPVVGEQIPLDAGDGLGGAVMEDTEAQGGAIL